jgi:aminoglycoside phosphotransferase (APT) family kinase protein
LENIVKDQEFTERIAAYLRRQIPQAENLTATVGRIMGGRSWDIFGVEARWEEKGKPCQDDLVFRVAPPGGILDPHDPSLDFRLLETYLRNDIPVPRPYWLEMDTAAIGRPFYVMEWIKADFPDTTDARFEDPKEKERYGRAFAELLAKIHNIDWRAEKLDEFLPPAGAPGDDPIEREIAWYEERAASLDVPPTPGLRAMFKWLRANRPIVREEDLRLVYGDFRFDNLFWKDGEIVATLDYEMALIGHPMEDVVFTRFLSDWAGMYGDQIPYYEELTGIPVNEDLVAYFSVLKQTQIGVIVGLAGLDALNKGRVKDARALSLASSAHVGSGGMLGHLLQAGT